MFSGSMVIAEKRGEYAESGLEPVVSKLEHRLDVVRRVVHGRRQDHSARVAARSAENAADRAGSFLGFMRVVEAQRPRFAQFTLVIGLHAGALGVDLDVGEAFLQIQKTARIR